MEANFANLSKIFIGFKPKTEFERFDMMAICEQTKI